MAGLLEGVKVLDLTRLLPGPLCTLHLADQGADVVKIEDPHAGDYARTDLAFGVSMSHLFHALNRGKRSIRLDLKSEDGRAALLELVRDADVLVESFRPGTLEKLGLAPDRLQAGNPGLVVCRISAYGQTGPLADKAAHDINMVGYAGLASQFPSHGGRLRLPGFQIADVAGGALTAAAAISMALVRKVRDGQGAVLDVAMAEAALSAGVTAFAMTQFHGRSPEPEADVLTGLLPCYGFYATKDGGQIAMGALEPKFWRAFCALVDRPDLEDKGLAVGPDGEHVKAELEKLFATKPLGKWTELLDGADCCVTPVLSIEQALTLPHFAERGLVYEAEDPVDGVMTRIGGAFLVDGERVKPAAPAPRHGEHDGDYEFNPARRRSA
ncbi:MAG: CaiB/BaiF CoA transferase family protein [Oceanicaulis sp.]